MAQEYLCVAPPAEMTKLIYDLRKDPEKYLTIRFRLF
jgi:hypothetical protein